MLLARSAVVMAALILSACATVQQTENVAPNDPAALAAIRAAYVKAGQQKSFRGRMVTEGEGKVSLLGCLLFCTNLFAARRASP